MRTEKNDIVVFDPKVAKDLILKGFIVVNIVPDSRVKNATVFYFENNKPTRDRLKEKWGIVI